jgi:phosphatidate cytidylyltransferase
VPLDVVLLMRGDHDRRARRRRLATGTGGAANVAAAVLPIVYIGLPLGALAAVRALGGREAPALLMATIVISDSAQYYTGRALGRRALAPAISPKKTVEGAVGGCDSARSPSSPARA